MKLLFYGQSARWIGCNEMSIPVDGTRPLVTILESSPKLAPILEHKNMLLVSVNYAVRAFDTAVADSDEVAFLPPFGEG
ncbi:MAG: MoaD/ThiS family protein [Lentisphaerae bacterium]|nr:MoaD/ThiS family protein [Lentisphaerota bacterium]